MGHEWDPDKLDKEQRERDEANKQENTDNKD